MALLAYSLFHRMCGQREVNKYNCCRIVQCKRFCFTANLESCVFVNDKLQSWLIQLWWNQYAPALALASAIISVESGIDECLAFVWELYYVQKLHKEQKLLFSVIAFITVLCVEYLPIHHLQHNTRAYMHTKAHWFSFTGIDAMNRWKFLFCSMAQKAAESLILIWKGKIKRHFRAQPILLSSMKLIKRNKRSNPIEFRQRKATKNAYYVESTFAIIYFVCFVMFMLNY